jgi:hypothetical protein
MMLLVCVKICRVSCACSPTLFSHTRSYVLTYNVCVYSERAVTVPKHRLDTNTETTEYRVVIVQGNPVSAIRYHWSHATRNLCP